MTEKVKKFIETNLDAIDNDLTQLFLIAFDDLNNNDMKELCSILDAAEIDYEQRRQSALNYIITMACEDFAGVTDSGGVTAMPVRDFIEVYLDNRLGYSIDYVRNYISINISEYADMVELVYEYDMDIIKVRGV
jgi:hypothetical protein